MIEFDSVSYTYPFQDAQSLKNFSMRLEPGGCSVCTGVSGCGKSTVIRLVNGLIPHYFKGSVSGRVEILGMKSGLRSVRETSCFVGTLLQDPEQQFMAMTVEEDISLSLEWKGYTPSEIKRRTDYSVDVFGLSSIRKSSVYELSEGQKQKAVLAGIMASSPEILVLDEPSANLDPESTAELAVILSELKSNGTSVFISDHRLYWLGQVAQNMTIMGSGETIASGAFSLLDDDALRSSHGLRKTKIEDSRQTLPDVEKSGGFFGAESLSFTWKGGRALFSDLSFGVEKGQVIALTGENGAGKTTLARLLTGLVSPEKGRVILGGRPAGKKDLLKKVSLVLQNTDHQLYMNTARQEMLYSAGRKISMTQKIAAVNVFLEKFGLSHIADRHPHSLSGGEKQRLVIACAMIRGPEILILDEPTSGLDGRNLGLMASSIRDFASSGGVVIVITHDLELMEMVCTHRLDLSKKIARG